MDQGSLRLNSLSNLVIESDLDGWLAEAALMRHICMGCSVFTVHLHHVFHNNSLFNDLMLSVRVLTVTLLTVLNHLGGRVEATE